MTTAHFVRNVTTAVVLSVGLLLGGCAASPGTSPMPAPADQPIPASGEVVGQGTVLQLGDAAPQFCLGGVMESYPPQCSGPELIGWDWQAVDGAETSGNVTWGNYAVQGTWDGANFTVTAPPIMLALYDPIRVDNPYQDPANKGATSEDELLRIQAELHESAPFDVLTSWTENGYLFATVTYDDGDIQAYLDAEYGKDVVIAQSALRDLAG